MEIGGILRETQDIEREPPGGGMADPQPPPYDVGTDFLFSRNRRRNDPVGLGEGKRIGRERSPHSRLLMAEPVHSTKERKTTSV